MATLAAKLLQYRPLFIEKGMQHVYNELRSFSNTLRETANLNVGSAYGGSDYVTHCNPDVAERVPAPTQVGFVDVAPKGDQSQTVA